MEPNKFESNWMTFTLALVIIIGACVLLFTGMIDPEVWKWAVTSAIGAYALKSAVGKISNK